jgi:hypothetical protein
MNINRYIVTLVIAVFGFSVRAQYFQYSQYNFTDQRVNPAYVAASDYARANFIFRNQQAGGEVNLRSTLASAAYPLLTRRDGTRWSGIGLSLLNDFFHP